MVAQSTKPSLDIETLVLENIEELCDSVVNFPGLMDLAVKQNLITKLEKETILRRYATLHDKLISFFLLTCSKGDLNKLMSVLFDTNNVQGIKILEQKNDPAATNGVHLIINDSRMLAHKNYIINNLEKLCRYTSHVSQVFTFSMGLGLISGRDKEAIESSASSEYDQLAEFYRMVANRGESAYMKLDQVLTLTQNYWVLDVLQSNLKLH